MWKSIKWVLLFYDFAYLIFFPNDVTTDITTLQTAMSKYKQNVYFLAEQRLCHSCPKTIYHLATAYVICVLHLHVTLYQNIHINDVYTYKQLKQFDSSTTQPTIRRTLIRNSEKETVALTHSKNNARIHGSKGKRHLKIVWWTSFFLTSNHF